MRRMHRNRTAVARVGAAADPGAVSRRAGGIELSPPFSSRLHRRGRELLIVGRAHASDRIPAGGGGPATTGEATALVVALSLIHI